MIRWQLERRKIAAKLLLPIVELRVKDFSFEPLALPCREVSTLKNGFRERACPSTARSLVERRKLGDENAGGPTIEHDVMDVDQQHVFFGRKFQQTDT